MAKRRNHRGGSQSKLRTWINKGLQLEKKHGIPLIKNHKLISRGLDQLSTSGHLGKYSKLAKTASNFASQRGYGLRSAGAGIRSAGSGRCGFRRRRR